MRNASRTHAGTHTRTHACTHAPAQTTLLRRVGQSLRHLQLGRNALKLSTLTNTSSFHALDSVLVAAPCQRQTFYQRHTHPRLSALAAITRQACLSRLPQDSCPVGPSMSLRCPGMADDSSSHGRASGMSPFCGALQLPAPAYSEANP